MKYLQLILDFLVRLLVRISKQVELFDMYRKLLYWGTRLSDIITNSKQLEGNFFIHYRPP